MINLLITDSGAHNLSHIHFYTDRDGMVPGPKPNNLKTFVSCGTTLEKYEVKRGMGGNEMVNKYPLICSFLLLWS